MSEPETNPTALLENEVPSPDELDGELLRGAQTSDPGVSWGTDLIYMPSDWIMVTEDIGITNGERALLVANAKSGDKDAAKLCETAKQVILEMMRRTRIDKPVEDDRGRAVFLDENGKDTIKPSNGGHGEDLIVYKRKTERRSAFGIRKGREAQSGPGTKYLGEAYWKRMVEENFYDLLPKLEFKHKDFGAVTGNFGSQPNALEFAKQRHAEIVANDNSAQRQRLLKWLVPFLKNPVSSWDGEE